ncbi:MAG: ATP-binding cassette domain-containing protein [Planctomycetota bacterium]
MKGARVEAVDLAFGYAGDPFRLAIPHFALVPGEAVALIGPSGSGKSTLLSLLAGILLPDRGRVEFEGRCWSELSSSARRARRIAGVGLVFQEFELLEALSVRENVLVPYHVNPALTLDPGVERRAREIMDGAGILPLADKRPRSLSGGERQRVALCRALVAEPALILADEPTGNLDHATATHAIDLLFEARARGATLAVVTHDEGLLPRFDRTVDFAPWASRGGVPVGATR